MDLSNAMRAATEDPPPTAIDVDRLIAGERRRSRNLHRVAGVAVAAALALGVTVLPAYLQRSGHSPGLAPPTTVVTTTAPAEPLPPCVTPQATGEVVVGGVPPLKPVTEECAVAQDRLLRELGRLIKGMRPAGGVTVKVQSDPTSHSGYNVLAELDGRLVLVVRLSASGQTRAEFRAFNKDQCPAGTRQPRHSCRTATQGGTELLIRAYPVPPSDIYGIDVWAERADGTSVIATVRALDTSSDVTPFSEGQLIELVTSAAATVYP